VKKQITKIRKIILFLINILMFFLSFDSKKICINPNYLVGRHLASTNYWQAPNWLALI